MTRTITFELHQNATVDEKTLIAFNKWVQFNPELVHIMLNGMIAQSKYYKEQKAIKTQEGQVATIKA